MLHSIARVTLRLLILRLYSIARVTLWLLTLRLHSIARVTLWLLTLRLYSTKQLGRVLICAFYIYGQSPHTRTALFWITAQRIVVISYRRFGTTYRSHPQWSGIQKRTSSSRAKNPIYFGGGGS